MAVPAAVAAPFLLEAGEKVAGKIVEVAQTPVIGWTEIRTFDKGRKHPVHVEQKRSVEIRAWELALGAGLVWLFLGAPIGNGKSFFSFDPFNLIPANPLGWDPFRILPTSR